MTKEPINVNGKRLNKLEEVVRLLQKLNEDYFSQAERDECGYRLSLVLSADGSGVIHNADLCQTFYQFQDLTELEEFLKGSMRLRFELAKNAIWRSTTKKKENR